MPNKAREEPPPEVLPDDTSGSKYDLLELTDVGEEVALETIKAAVAAAAEQLIDNAYQERLPQFVAHRLMVSVSETIAWETLSHESVISAAAPPRADAATTQTWFLEEEPTPPTAERWMRGTVRSVANRKRMHNALEEEVETETAAAAETEAAVSKGTLKRSPTSAKRKDRASADTPAALTDVPDVDRRTPAEIRRDQRYLIPSDTRRAPCVRWRGGPKRERIRGMICGSLPSPGAPRALRRTDHDCRQRARAAACTFPRTSSHAVSPRRVRARTPAVLLTAGAALIGLRRWGCVVVWGGGTSRSTRST